MTPADAALVQSLPALAFQAVLVFARLGAAVMVLPGLGEAEVPAPVRLAIGLGLVLLLLPPLAPGLPGLPETPAAIALLVGQEVLIGLWLGGLARLVALALGMAGQLAATLIGLQGLLVNDPELGPQATALARALGLATAVLVLASGLHGVALTALVESYALIPAGAALPVGVAAAAVAAAGADSLALALRLAAPFVIGAVVLNLALGLLARLAPQVQTFFIAIPGQILAGIALLALLAPPMVATFAQSLSAAFHALPGAR
jgi:flagellar biosynthetic protein FliR